MSNPLDQIAARQHGCFSLDQAHNSGYSSSMINRRLSTGAWIRLGHRSFAMASSPATWDRQLAAATLSKKHAVVGGRSAAFLLGFDGFRRSRPEIIVPETVQARSPIAKIIRSIYYDRLGTQRVSGFTVTNRYETILQLAGRVTIPLLEDIVDDQLATNKITIDGFDPVITRSIGGRVRGIARLAEILDIRRPDAWQPHPNQIERFLAELVDHPDVPPAQPQTPLVLDGQPMIVDTFIPDWGLVLEGDGRRFHTRLMDFERDRERDNAAATHGLATLRFTWRKLTTEFDACQKQLLKVGQVRSSSSSRSGDLPTGVTSLDS